MISLREAAAELDMSRKRLLRLVREGLPVTRKGERVYVDLDVARQWIADNEPRGPKRAARLHPDDPRYRERVAAAKVAELKAAAARGELLPADEIKTRLGDELTALRAELFALASRLGLGASLPAADVERGLTAELDDVLSHLAADAPGAWPEPQPAPEDDSWLDADDDEPGETLPLLTAPDPRHAWARAQAEKRERELDSVYSAYLAGC